MAPALQWIETRHGEDSSLFIDPFVIKKLIMLMAPALKISSNTDVGQSMTTKWAVQLFVHEQNISRNNRRYIKTAGIGKLPRFHPVPTASLPHFTFCFKLAVPSISDGCHVKCNPRASCCRDDHLLKYNRGNFRVDFCGCRFDYAAFVSWPGHDQAALEAYHGHGGDWNFWREGDFLFDSNNGFHFIQPGINSNGDLRAISKMDVVVGAQFLGQGVSASTARQARLRKTKQTVWRLTFYAVDHFC